MVKRTARPSGRNRGQEYAASPLALSSFSNSSASPPFAETLKSPTPLRVNTIVSSGPQAAPSDGELVGATMMGEPPPIGTFFKAVMPSKKPIHAPSGDTNG